MRSENYGNKNHGKEESIVVTTPKRKAKSMSSGKNA